jgi:uncharacterized DUF497 family protein
MKFRWNAWNTDHIGDHGIERDEAEFVIRGARPPYPEERGDDKWRVWGQSATGGYLQVVFVLDAENTIYVIHARPLTEKEKKRFRRRTKRR